MKFYSSTRAKYQPGAEKSSDFRFWPREWKTIYFKEYPRLPKISLPRPENFDFSLVRSLKERKSQREFQKEPISLKDLSHLLFYSAGIIEKREGDWNKTRRTYPSGGGRFPLEIYLCWLEKSRELEKGIYHYHLKEQVLERILKEENLRKEIYPKIIWQEMVEKAPLILAISAVFERTTMKYRERGERYIFLEAGHLGQNIYLVAQALNLQCCAIGGFDDDRFNELLDLDGRLEGVIYAFALGRKLSTEK